MLESPSCYNSLVWLGLSPTMYGLRSYKSLGINPFPVCYTVHLFSWELTGQFYTCTRYLHRVLEGYLFFREREREWEETRWTRKLRVGSCPVSTREMTGGPLPGLRGLKVLLTGTTLSTARVAIPLEMVVDREMVVAGVPYFSLLRRHFLIFRRKKTETHSD